MTKVEKVEKEAVSEVSKVSEMAVKAEEVESAEKIAFRKLIENYSKVNPVKYEMKKEALEKQLNEMK